MTITNPIKLISCLLTLLMCLSANSVTYADSSAQKPEELVFLTWSDYINMDIVAEFEKKNNAKIRFIYFDSDDVRDMIMADADGEGYDLICINEVQITPYVKNGWLAPLTTKEVPSLKHIEKKWLEAYPEGSGYTLPYFWGTVGIAYRSDLVSEPITSWKQFFEPNDDLSKKILFLETAREVVGVALKALGYSLNSTNIEEIQQAEALLQKQRPHLESYKYFSTSEKSSLISGEKLAAFAYNGDALVIADFNPNIKFVVPEEGGSLWVDHLAVSASSKNKQLAYRFLDHINSPAISAQQAQEFYYATPNSEAEKLLPEEFLSNPIIYPDQKTLDKSEFYQMLPLRIIKQHNRIMTDLTH